ncbi:MAG: gamma-glutamylcyclotransferase family protein [Gammaproteobacteria bacterium]
MPLLFSYGTLRDEEVQIALFDRRLVGREDYILGYKEEIVRVEDPKFARTSGKAHHSILRKSERETDRVKGMAFEVTDAELEVADSYEPAEYMRVIAGLASGGQAWVYVEAQVGGK